MNLQQIKDWYLNITNLYEQSGYNAKYHLNFFWKDEVSNRIKKIFNEATDSLDFIHKIQDTVLYQITTSNDYKYDGVNYQLDILKESGINVFEMPDSIQESKFMRPDHLVEVNGRKFTTDFFRYLNAIILINKYQNEFGERPLIMELGAGTGNLARLFKLFHPKSTYIITDIPETLIFSYAYLSLNFPNAKILLLSSENELSAQNILDYDFIFAPTKFAELFKNNKVDLFINTASMGEMRNDVISYWMNFIQNDLKPKFLYTLNRYLNVLVPGIQDDYRKEENMCSVLYNRNWQIEKWRLDPDYIKCPYDFFRHARYLEIMARYKDMSAENAVEESSDLTRKILNQDWYREFLLYQNDKVVKYRLYLFATDLSMRGTLFLLWNAIRLDPENKVALKAMLRFLYLMNPREYTEFEEYFYYKELFLSKFSDKNPDDVNFMNWLKKRDFELFFNKENIPATPIQKPQDGSQITLLTLQNEELIFLKKLVHKRNKRKKRLKKLRSRLLRPVNFLKKILKVIKNK